MTETASNVDEYIAGFPDKVQHALHHVRRLVRNVAPDAKESISYRIPAYKLRGKVLVYFAGWADHVSLCPIPPGDDAFGTRVKEYQYGKATVRLPLDQPLPEEFITQFVELHVQRLS